MTLSTQTQTDLRAVVELLDQRIYELIEGSAQPAPSEAMRLQSLRDQVVGLLPCEMA